MTKFGFGGELLLFNLDVLESLDQADMHNQYHKQVYQSIKSKRKSSQAYFKVNSDLDDF